MINDKNQQKGIERRNFLKALSLTGAGSMLLSNSILAKPTSKNETTSRVVIVSDDNASDKPTKKLNARVIQTMVDKGIMQYTGLNSIGEAWKSIFSGITISSVIGLKVSTLFGASNNGTHPEIAYAVVEGLKKMDFNGTSFPENNIIIFDFKGNNLEYKGYKMNEGSTGVRCYASKSYSNEYNLPDNIKVKLSSIITSEIDFLINIAYLKHHSLSGVSLCLKNHYGSLEDPSINDLMHDLPRCGNPYISAITALEPIKSKQMFCMIDAIYGITKYGPSGPIDCNPNKIIMGQDVVAVDCVGREMLKTKGLSDIDYSRTKHIDTAATTYNLGTNDLTKIEQVEIVTTSIINMEQVDKVRNYPNPFSESTTINFELLKNEVVNLNIFDYSGKLIIKLVNKKLEAGKHSILWNGNDINGTGVKSGVYLAELRTKSFKKTLIIQKIE
jgi:uncharacterized protein (DUF362 family)